MGATNKFSISLEEWAKQAENKADLVVKSALIDIMGRIDMRSPVGQKEIWAANVERASRGLAPLPKGYTGGRFRANWQLGVNSKPSGTIDAIDKTGESTQAAAISNIPEKVLGNRFFYVNNQPYGPRLENGWSKQAPLGIVGLAILEWQGILTFRARGAK